MSNKLFDFRALLDRDLYSPREEYLLYVSQGGQWYAAEEYGVKGKFETQEEAATQKRMLDEITMIDDTLLAKKSTISFSDLETKQTHRVTEWLALLV